MMIECLYFFRNTRNDIPHIFSFGCVPLPGTILSLYLDPQRSRRGQILDDIGLGGGTKLFFIYFAELLENPKRSGTHPRF